MRQWRQAAVFFFVGMGVALAGGAAAMKATEAEPARVAVCDVYGVIEKLLDTDRFKPAREVEQKNAEESLQPLQQELTEMEHQLQNANPEDQNAQETYKQYQKKRQEFQQKATELQTRLRKFMSKQFVDAYGMVKTSADAVAEDMGYDYVIASRGIDEEIKTDDPDRVVQAVLARPIVKLPKGADITTDVKADLKLE